MSLHPHRLDSVHGDDEELSCCCCGLIVCGIIPFAAGYGIYRGVKLLICDLPCKVVRVCCKSSDYHERPQHEEAVNHSWHQPDYPPSTYGGRHRQRSNMFPPHTSTHYHIDRRNSGEYAPAGEAAIPEFVLQRPAAAHTRYYG